MENRQNKPPEGEAASGHDGQKFYTDSEQAKLHKSKLRMESREDVERHIKCTKEIKLNAKRNNVKFHSIQII